MKIKYLAWLDFETTGLSFVHDEVIEAAVYITDMNYEPVSIKIAGTKNEFQPCRFDLIGQCSPSGIQRIYSNQIVYEMHVNNGLLNVLENGQGGNIMEFFWRMEAMMLELGEPGEFRLAGSGVERFDRHFLDKLWPTWNDWMPYRCHDISNVRTFLEDIGLGWMVRPSTIDPSSHRAMPDVLRSIDEARHLADFLTRAATLQKPAEPNEGD